ncbi:hypothetical protein ULG90_06050 [Halopseudomonas pachastrellae]|nr:hypothetical protein ULG90_06050 [Halopseudomonas pachastrellae]
MVENPLLARALIKIAIGLAALITLFGALTIALASILGPFAMIRLGLSLFGVKAMGLLPILKAVGTAFMWLGRALLLNPIGLAITLLVTAGWLLYKNWDGVIGGLKALWADLGRGAKAIWAEITTAFDGGILGWASSSPTGHRWACSTRRSPPS